MYLNIFAGRQLLSKPFKTLIIDIQSLEFGNFDRMKHHLLMAAIRVMLSNIGFLLRVFIEKLFFTLLIFNSCCIFIANLHLLSNYKVSIFSILGKELFILQFFILILWVKVNQIFILALILLIRAGVQKVV